MLPLPSHRVPDAGPNPAALCSTHISAFSGAYNRAALCASDYATFPGAYEHADRLSLHARTIQSTHLHADPSPHRCADELSDIRTHPYSFSEPCAYDGTHEPPAFLGPHSISVTSPDLAGSDSLSDAGTDTGTNEESDYSSPDRMHLRLARSIRCIAEGCVDWHFGTLGGCARRRRPPLRLPTSVRRVYDWQRNRAHGRL